MNIFQKVSLKDYSTMRLGGIAQYLVDVNSKDELLEAVKWAKLEKLSMLIIGEGTNIIWKDSGFDGLIIVNKIMGFEAFTEDQNNLLVTVGAGENWDFLVKRIVDMGYSGIESLSLIPGTVGSAPIQNIGAYGNEISNSLVSIEALDITTNEFVNISNEECSFEYRSSKFKSSFKGRYFIVAVTLKVDKNKPEAPFYAAIQKHIDENKITKITPRVLREIVTNIRQSKLPDPKIVPNCGSFFTNPIIDKELFKNIQKDSPDLVYWEVADGKYKLAAGWLIERVGYKGINDPETGMSTWPTQALIFVNSSATSTNDLLKFKDKIVKEVKLKFNVSLNQEPELLP